MSGANAGKMGWSDMRKRTGHFALVTFCLLSIIFGAGCSDEAEHAGIEQLLDQAYALANEGRWEDAMRFSAQAYQLRPDNTAVRLMQAFALENNGRENEALEISRMAADDDRSFLAQYTYGRMLFQRKRYEHAQGYLKKAQELKNDDFNTLLMLQQTAARLGQHTENQNLCRELMNRYGEKCGKDFRTYIYNELALNILNGVSSIGRGTKGKLEKIFALAVNSSPSSPELAWNLAVFYEYYLKDFSAAKKHYERFLQLTEKYSGMEKERAAVKERLYKSGK